MYILQAIIIKDSLSHCLPLVNSRAFVRWRGRGLREGFLRAEFLKEAFLKEEGGGV
jgi:hypothetical protein